MAEFYSLFPGYKKEEVDLVINRLTEKRKNIICMTFGLLGYQSCCKTKIAQNVACKRSEIDTRVAYIIRLIEVSLQKNDIINMHYKELGDTSTKVL